MVLVATLNLIFLVMAWIGTSSFLSISSGLVINIVALVLGLLPSTKAAFWDAACTAEAIAEASRRRHLQGEQHSLKKGNS